MSRLTGIAILLVAAIATGSSADLVQSYGQVSGPFPRYSLFASSEGLFLLDQATGCVWKRFQFPTGIAWNMEFTVTDQAEGRVGCYISLAEYNRLSDLVRKAIK